MQWCETAFWRSSFSATFLVFSTYPWKSQCWSHTRWHPWAYPAFSSTCLFSARSRSTSACQNWQKNQTLDKSVSRLQFFIFSFNFLQRLQMHWAYVDPIDPDNPSDLNYLATVSIMLHASIPKLGVHICMCLWNQNRNATVQTNGRVHCGETAFSRSSLSAAFFAISTYPWKTQRWSHTRWHPWAYSAFSSTSLFSARSRSASACQKLTEKSIPR